MWKCFLLLACEMAFFSYAKILPLQPETSRSMTTYISRMKFTSSKVFNVIGVIGCFEGSSAALVNQIMANTSRSYVISSSPEELCDFTQKEKVETLVYILQTSEELVTSVHLIKTTISLNLLQFIYFIILEVTLDSTWLETTMETLWINKVLNYVILLEQNDTIRVFGYNPFRKIVLSFSEFDVDLFPDLLKDMGGYEWRIGISEQVSNQKDYLNSNEISMDKMRIEEIAEKLNATTNYIVVNYSSEVTKQLLKQRVDFSTHRSLQLPNSTTIFQPSYPVAIDYLVIIVPTSALMARYKYLLLVFDTTVWACVVLALLLMYWTIYLFDHHLSHAQICGLTVRIFLNTSYNHKEMRSSFGLIVVTWSVYSMLIAMAFNTSLRGSLVKSKYEKQIKTVADVQANNLLVYINDKKYADVMEDFQVLAGQFKYLSPNHVLIGKALISKGDAGFVVPYRVAREIIRARSKNNNSTFKILKKRYVGVFRVFNFVTDSPFVGRFNRMFNIFEQYGLSQFGIREVEVQASSDFAKVRMSIVHLQSVFQVLVIGLGLGFLVFLVELIWVKVKTKLQLWWFGLKCCSWNY